MLYYALHSFTTLLHMSHYQSGRIWTLVLLKIWANKSNQT